MNWKKDFSCQRCGFCCQLDVVLEKTDIQRLTDAGFIRFSRKKQGEAMLRRIGKYCMFYDDEQCSVYEHRPDICRRFPFKKDGSINQQCRQMKDFSSQVTQKVIKFMIQEGRI